MAANQNLSDELMRQLRIAHEASWMLEARGFDCMVLLDLLAPVLQEHAGVVAEANKELAKAELHAVQTISGLITEIGTLHKQLVGWRDQLPVKIEAAIVIEKGAAAMAEPSGTANASTTSQGHSGKGVRP